MNELGRTSIERTASPEDLEAVKDFIIECLADGQSMTVRQLSQQWCEAHGSKSLIKVGLFNEKIRQALGEIEAEEDGSFGCLKETVVQDTNTTVTYYHLSGAAEGYQPAVMEPVDLADKLRSRLQEAINTVTNDYSPIDPGWAANARCAGMEIDKVHDGMCKECPVQSDCLRTAIREGYNLRHRDTRTSGVRGGYSPAGQQEKVEEVRKLMHGSSQKA